MGASVPPPAKIAPCHIKAASGGITRPDTLAIMNLPAAHGRKQQGRGEGKKEEGREKRGEGRGEIKIALRERASSFFLFRRRGPVAFLFGGRR